MNVFVFKWDVVTDEVMFMQINENIEMHIFVTLLRIVNVID